MWSILRHTQQGLHLLPRPKCPDCQLRKFLKDGNWSTKFTWQKFYNMNIEKDKTFEQDVLENVGTL